MLFPSWKVLVLVLLLLLAHSTKARFENRAVELGSTNHLSGLSTSDHDSLCRLPDALGEARRPISPTMTYGFTRAGGPHNAVFVVWGIGKLPRRGPHSFAFCANEWGLSAVQVRADQVQLPLRRQCANPPSLRVALSHVLHTRGRLPHIHPFPNRHSSEKCSLITATSLRRK